MGNECFKKNNSIQKKRNKKSFSHEHYNYPYDQPSTAEINDDPQDNNPDKNVNEILQSDIQKSNMDLCNNTNGIKEALKNSTKFENNKSKTKMESNNKNNSDKSNNNITNNITTTTKQTNENNNNEKINGKIDVQNQNLNIPYTPNNKINQKNNANLQICNGINNYIPSNNINPNYLNIHNQYSITIKQISDELIQWKNKFKLAQDNYNKQLIQLKKQNNDLINKNINSEKEIEKLKNSKNLLEQNLKSEKVTNNTLNNEIMKLKNKIDSLNYNINLLNQQIITLKNNNRQREIENKQKIKILFDNKLKNNINDKKYSTQLKSIGLDNIGATCYMNATLQCLSNTQELKKYFLEKYNKEFNPKDPSKKMSTEFYIVVDNLWVNPYNLKSYSPKSFKEAISKENPLFEGITANDSKDLINFLLERFHKELNKVPDKPYKNNVVITQKDQLDEKKMFNLFFVDFQKYYDSIISHLFYGVLETKSLCKGCGNIKFNFQIYSFIEFPLKQVNEYCFRKGKYMKASNNNKNPDVDLID